MQLQVATSVGRLAADLCALCRLEEGHIKVSPSSPHVERVLETSIITRFDSVDKVTASIGVMAKSEHLDKMLAHSSTPCSGGAEDVYITRVLGVGCPPPNWSVLTVMVPTI